MSLIIWLIDAWIICALSVVALGISAAILWLFIRVAATMIAAPFAGLAWLCGPREGSLKPYLRELDAETRAAMVRATRTPTVFWWLASDELSAGTGS